MCANYEPIRDLQRIGYNMRTLFDGEAPWPTEAWPLGLAPFVRRGATSQDVEACVGQFGMHPHWTQDIAYGRRTYNARSETASKLPSFRDAWKGGRRCIVPAESIFEPNYESGKAVRWRISRADADVMGLAGLWGWWRGPGGGEMLTFTLLTVNADQHPFMRRFHKPGDEKRSVVVLERAEWDAWLGSDVDQMMGFMRVPADDLLVGEPAPLPPRGKISRAVPQG